MGWTVGWTVDCRMDGGMDAGMDAEWTLGDAGWTLGGRYDYRPRNRYLNMLLFDFCHRLAHIVKVLYSVKLF